MQEKLIAELEEAERKAIDSLARYKFQMFGYWAAIWVHLNRISGENRSNPFRQLVAVAKKIKDDPGVEVAFVVETITRTDFHIEPDESDSCSHCGKEYGDWSDLGCGHCDARLSSYGVRP